MTISQILQCSADELKKMTDAELDAHFRPMYAITRPEMASKPDKSGNNKRVGNKLKDPKIALAAMMLKNFGVDLEDM